MRQTNIIVKFDIEGEHAWPEAPEEYRFLASRHRHIFHFEVHIPVTESRQLEFLDVRRELLATVKASYGYIRSERGGLEPCDFRGMSCEQLAESVSRSVQNKYKVWPYKVIVMEDAFVGAEIING